MKTETVPWSVFSCNALRDRITSDTTYQRDHVWNRQQRQLLVDSVLRGFDIPKLYFRVMPNGRYEVVDGKQRLTALLDFLDGKFALHDDAKDVDGVEIRRKKMTELDSSLISSFGDYKVSIALIHEATEGEIREMFNRLQNGTVLKAQERRNARLGDMRDYVCDVAKHKFFLSVPFRDSRFTYQQIAAQMCLLSLKRSVCNIKNHDLNLMYAENEEFDENSAEAKRIFKILNYLHRMFPTKAPELKRFNVISLFALVSELMDRYAIADREFDLAEWFKNFEYRRALDKKKKSENRDNGLVRYEAATSHSSDGEPSLRLRRDVLVKDLLGHVTNLESKDAKRMFDADQRQIIYRRDGGICQECKRHCEWDGEWHADHKKPWSAGGKTTVENGQLLCAECNLRKSAGR